MSEDNVVYLRKPDKNTTTLHYHNKPYQVIYCPHTKEWKWKVPITVPVVELSGTCNTKDEAIKKAKQHIEENE